MTGGAWKEGGTASCRCGQATPVTKPLLRRQRRAERDGVVMPEKAVGFENGLRGALHGVVERGLVGSRRAPAGLGGHVQPVTFTGDVPDGLWSIATQTARLMDRAAGRKDEQAGEQEGAHRR